LSLWLAAGSAAPLVLLALWAFAYPRTPGSSAILLLIALVAAIGGYGAAVGRRRALLDATLVPGTVASRLLRGRVGAVAIVSARIAATLPAIGYAALDPRLWEVGLAALMAAAAAALALLALGMLRSQVQPAFRGAVATAGAAWTLGLLFAVAHMAIAFNLTPTPAWCAGSGAADWVLAAQADLPRRNGWLAELFAAFRAVEAITWCAPLPSALDWLRAIYIVVQSGLVFFGLGILVSGFQLAALEARRAFAGPDNARFEAPVSDDL
jgi:hypothetical protein